MKALEALKRSVARVVMEPLLHRERSRQLAPFVAGEVVSKTYKNSNPSLYIMMPPM